MSKKNFQTAPKPQAKNPPSLKAIEDFEKGGPGHDDQPKKEATQKPVEPIKRLSIDLPASAHQRFKTACSATSRKMSQEIEEFIARRTKELEKEAGITRI